MTNAASLIAGCDLTLVVSLLICGVAFATSAETEDDLILGEWERTPKVILCGDAPVSEERLLDALQWWHRRGQHFELVSLSEDSRARRICADAWSSVPAGYIVVAKLVEAAIREKGDMAVTYYHQDSGSDKIKYAKVLFKEETVHADRLVEHELGHAFGFNHTDQSGHLMHTYHVSGGWLDHGLRRGGAPEVAEPEAAPEDGLTRARISTVIRRRIPQIWTCYEQQLRDNEALEGKIIATWEVTPSGGVEGVHIKSNATGNSDLPACVSKAISSWHFPASGSGADVEFPFVFRKAESHSISYR